MGNYFGAEGEPAEEAAVAGTTPPTNRRAQMDRTPSKSFKLHGNLVVSFENISVHVPGAGWNCCTCIDSPLKTYGQEYLGMSVEQRDPFDPLVNVTGYVKSGETCLVLGKSGSGKSTLLRALCGRLNDGDEMEGTVKLNGMPLPKSDQRWRRMSTYVSSSDSSHSPVLTVDETLTFAAQCTSNGTTPPPELGENVNEMLDVLGLSHVRKTVVGDENIRGVSGGQKRRVTFGEMAMDPNSCFMCLDNITDGLASTDSLTLIEHISQFCKGQGVAAVVSLLQPSDEIVYQFDKLMVLSGKGTVAYFGPVDRVLLREVFLGPDMDPAEADTGAIADLVLNQDFGGDESKKDVEEEAAERYLQSAAYKEMRSFLDEEHGKTPASAERKMEELDRILPSQKYSNSRLYQLRIIGSRRIKLIVRNAMTYARPMIAILFGIIIGSLFSALANDIIGALGRTGYMFLNCFLVLMLSAAVTLPEGFRQRTTLFKHRTAEFYSSRMAYLAQVVLDIPLSLVEAILLSVLSYFWVRMNPGVNNFFYFLGTLIGLEFVGQAFGRLLCAINRTQVQANAASSLYILLCGAVSGFMPAYNQITWVVRWLSWVTPVSYAFEGLMINEFDGRSFAGVSIVNSDGTTNLGTVQGNDWLGSSGLPRIQWATNNQIKLFDLAMLFVFAIVFDLIGMFFQEQTRDWFYQQIRRPVQKVKAAESKEGKTVGEEDDFAALTGPSSQPQSLAVRDLKYTVLLGRSFRCSVEGILGPCLVKMMGKKVEEKPAEKELTLLNGVAARFRRGRMTALMGQSGAGKTTLMDVIAGYKTGGKITGEIMIDGRPKLDSVWKRINGYAEQMDILNPYLSVMETLRFTAACRLPGGVDREKIIAHVIKLMGIEDYTDVVVGREKEGEGLPKHARKRLTIANQLVVLPKVLFLDEPTTGLGCSDAALVIGAVRRSTDTMGLITLATIHQPSRRMFETFDDLLLLAKGGRVAYMGELGNRSKTVLDYFSGLSDDEPEETCNPADYVLATVDSIGADKAVEAFSASNHCSVVATDIDSDLNKADGEVPSYAKPSEATRTFFMEFGLLCRRHLMTAWRNPSYSFMRMNVSFFTSLFLGVLFFGVQNNVQGAVFSIAAVFFLVFVLVIPMQASVIPLIEDRAVLYRESVSGTYSRLSYGLGQLVADVPFHAINTVLMFIAFYFITGFREGAEYMGYFLLMLFLANWVVMSMGQLYALVTPNEETANGLAGLSVILSVCLMGFLITVSAMPGGWVWAYWVNMFRYILQGLVTNQVSGQSYHINVSSLISDIPQRQDLPSPQSLIAFEPGVVPEDGNLASEISHLLGLAIAAGPGNNTDFNLGSMGDWVNCTITNECFGDPDSFVSCNIFKFPRGPPCKDEFNAAVSDLDIGAISACFLPDFPFLSGNDGDTADESNATAAAGVPDTFSSQAFQNLTESSQGSLVLCLMRAVLPPESKTAVRSLLKIVDNIFEVVAVVVDIINKGIDLPGDAILFYFGWSSFAEGEFTAPWKWHYCLTAVAVFLVGIELMKLFSSTFIVWTKR